MQLPDRQEHIDSYYAASRNLSPTWAPLSGPLEVDTCVIGGGLAGLGTALPLAEAGVNVAVLEAARIGFGASGRNGGQVIHGWAAGMGSMAAQIGPERARRLWDMSMEAVALVDERIRRFNIDCDWRRGYATVAVKPRHMAELRDWHREAQTVYGYHGYQEWSAEQLQSQLDSTRYVGALYDEDSGHLHPLNYCTGLAAAASQSGVQIFEHTPMTGFAPLPGGGYRIDTPGGQVQARRVVLAVNVFIENLTQPALRQLAAKILPVGTYIIATEPLGDVATQLIRNRMAVCDTRFVLDYYRLSADQRLLFGGRVNYSGREPDTARLKQVMRQAMLRVFPQLADARIDYTWGGQVDISMSRAPHFGRLAPDVYFMQGFSGHGVAASGIGGLVTAEAILGDDSRLRVFEALNHRPFPGGRHLRLPTQWLGMSYYRLKDWLP